MNKETINRRDSELLERYHDALLRRASQRGDDFPQYRNKKRNKWILGVTLSTLFVSCLAIAIVHTKGTSPLAADDYETEVLTKNHSSLDSQATSRQQDSEPPAPVLQQMLQPVPPIATEPEATKLVSDQANSVSQPIVIAQAPVTNTSGTNTSGTNTKEHPNERDEDREEIPNIELDEIRAVRTSSTKQSTQTPKVLEEHGIAVARLVVCKDVVDREPVDPVESFNSNESSSITVFTEIKTAKPPREIRHVYYLENKKYFELPLAVNYTRMRTWSRITLKSDAQIGDWRVEILDEDDNVLDRGQFVVLP